MKSYADEMAAFGQSLMMKILPPMYLLVLMQSFIIL
jgi:hypothetical protein